LFSFCPPFSKGGEGESGEAPPAAEETSCFRGSGVVGSLKRAANRIAATVFNAPGGFGQSPTFYFIISHKTRGRAQTRPFVKFLPAF